MWPQGRAGEGFGETEVLGEELQSQLALRINCKQWPALPRSWGAALQPPAHHCGGMAAGSSSFTSLFNCFWMGFVLQSGSGRVVLWVWQCLGICI